MNKTKVTRAIVVILCIIIFIVFSIMIFSHCNKHYPITETGGYTFEVDEKQNATLVKTDMTSEIVAIPSKISSYDVKKLGGDRKIGGILAYGSVRPKNSGCISTVCFISRKGPCRER